MVAALAGAAPAPSPAVAAAKLQPCGPRSPVLCGRVSVPVDRAGQVPGRISLAVSMVRAAGRARGTILFVPGGPGEAATILAPQLGNPRNSPLGSVLRDHDLLLVDHRGTGRSGALRCREFERPSPSADPGALVAGCAASLGARRDYYQTRDAADDIEAVRRALGLGKLSLIGVSYGTKLSVVYARRHPQGVRRLVLDSVLGPDGVDLLQRGQFAALPPVLRALCSAVCARAVNPDPLGDLRGLVAQLRAREPLVAAAVGYTGRRYPTPLTRGALLGLVLGGDLAPVVFAELPAALRSARNGDPASLVRLFRLSGGLDEILEDPQRFSSVLLTASLCSESKTPWAPGTPPGGTRVAQMRAFAAAQGEAVFDPFDGDTAVQAGFAGQCVSWPSPSRPAPDYSGTGPAVPALLLNGTLDLRTSLAGARAVAGTLPRARLVAVGGVGHSVLSHDLTGCARRVVARFFAGSRTVGACPRGGPAPPVAPVAPTSLAALPPLPGAPAAVGRIACGVGLTIGDSARTLTGGKATPLPGGRVSVRAPGLRSGTVTLRVRTTSAGPGTLTFQNYSYVPGLAISGVEGRPLRVGGSAAVRGTFAVRRGRLVGRLGGRAVDIGLGPCLGGGPRRPVTVPIADLDRDKLYKRLRVDLG